MSSIEAKLWCEPGATVVENADGVRGTVTDIVAGYLDEAGAVVPEMAQWSACWDHLASTPLAELTVPLDTPTNLLGVLRAVWRTVSGEEAPALLTLRRRCAEGDAEPRCVWSVEGVDCQVWFAHCECTCCECTGVLDRIVPDLDGVTDPVEAAAIIARVVLA
jgi:hypothetical protein